MVEVKGEWMMGGGGHGGGRRGTMYMGKRKQAPRLVGYGRMVKPRRQNRRDYKRLALRARLVVMAAAAGGKLSKGQSESVCMRSERV